MKQSQQPYTGPFPRNRHSHRCQTCGEGMTCHKSKCTQPQRVEVCGWCPSYLRQTKPAPTQPAIF